MRLAILAIAATVFFSGPAAAEWKEYMYRDLGIAKEFPNPPERETSEYTSPLIGTAPATMFAVEDDNIVYSLTVVELPDKVAISADLLGECVRMAEDEGEVLANMTTRVEGGVNAVYGRLVSVDLADGGGRRQTACSYTKGRLYKIQATILPEHGQPNSSQAIRFTNSLRFRLDREYGEE